MISKNSQTKLSDGGKILLILGVVMAAVGGYAGYNLYTMNSIATETVAIAEFDMPIIEITTKITVHQLEQAINFERALRYAEVDDWDNYSHAKEKFFEYAHLVDEEFVEAEHMVEGAIAHATTQHNREEFEHVLEILYKTDAQHADFDHKVEEVFSLIESDRMDEALVLAHEVEVLEEELDHELESLIFELEKFTQEALHTVEKHEQEAVMVMIIMTAAALAITGIAMLFTKKLDGLLKRIVNVTERVSKGDLTVNESDINARGSQIASVYMSMVSNLRNLIVDTKASTETVSSQAETAAAASEELTASVEQISSAVQQIAQGSSSQAVAISEAKNIVENVTSNDNGDGGSASERMQKIVELTKESSEKVKNLAEKSAKITDVIEVIRSIAEKTNLLSLNAAVEAARAGESGRGFAVVADEVRRLADGSAKSSSEIDNLIKQIKEEIDSTVQGIEESSKEIESGKVVVETSLRALADVGVKLQEISAVAEENSSASEETSASVEQQTGASKDIAESSQQVLRSTHELSEKVNVFNLEDKNMTMTNAKSDAVKSIPQKKSKFSKLNPLSQKDKLTLNKMVKIDEEKKTSLDDFDEFEPDIKSILKEADKE